jgi:NOL1/NOP2/fmu family ribosome biogenesis protein/23S rRNA U2552 (ribose-2'-O)-methylase RlmE/FtsJ
VLDPNIRPGGFLEYAAADYYIQDAGSMLPLAMLDIQPEDQVCDLCAAPGGKATAIAEMLGPNGFLLANEVIASRLDVLRYALARTGRANAWVSNQDPESLAECLAGTFDKVLVDVPCSGQSLVGRKRQSESSFSTSHVQHCAARAERILRSALRLVRPGGRLVLSTCTFAVEENEAQVQSMLESYSGALAVDPCRSLEAWESPILAGCYRLWPHRDQCAGGFAASIVVQHQIEPQAFKPSGRSDRRSQRESQRPNGSRKPIPRTCDLDQQFSKLGMLKLSLTREASLCVGFEPGAERFFQEHGNRIGQGLRIAQVDRDRLEPYHGLSMLLESLFTPSNVLDLDDSNAKRYMLGESLDRALASNQPEIAQTPWSVVRWKEKPLGWVKSASNRWNNYLPSWARFTSFATTDGCD